MWGTGLIFALYPLAQTTWLMGCCAALLGIALGASQPMVMTTLHHLTPEDRHGQALALRSIAINLSSTVMPLSFGVAGAAVGAAGLFWICAALVGARGWTVRRFPGAAEGVAEPFSPPAPGDEAARRSGARGPGTP